MAFVKKELASLTLNPFTAIGDEWFLLTAGTLDDYNTMTASWGAMGVIWGGPAMTAVVRTSRHTYSYMEEQDTFSVSILPEEYRKALQFCGTHSGRDCDKAKETGLTPIEIDGVTAFAEAKMVLVCEKMYAQMMAEEHFTQPELAEKWYSTDPMHKMYIGRIKAAYVQE